MNSTISSAPSTRSPTPDDVCFELESLSVRSRQAGVLDRVNWTIAEHRVTALIGPSGVGKSTLLRCLNRLIDLSPGLQTEGAVRFRGRCVSADGCPDRLRERIGMVFQQPVLFPGSVRDNVVFGVRRLRRLGRRQLGELTERVLREASLWDQVSDRLDARAEVLSVGQQQRLCLARALAGDPEVLLMDEPTSALDPRSSEAIEQWMLDQKGRRTVVLVTHAIGQAHRVADRVGAVLPGPNGGRLVFDGPPGDLVCADVPSNLRDWLGG